MQSVTDPQATRPMRRVRHRSPRLSNIRFLVLMFTGVDIALAGLAAVLFLTPLHPNYPVDTAPVLTPRPPQASAPAVLLPVGHTTPYKPPVSPRSTAPAHHPAVPRPRPSATLTAVPVVTATKTPAPSPTATATSTPTSTSTTPTAPATSPLPSG